MKRTRNQPLELVTLVERESVKLNTRTLAVGGVVRDLLRKKFDHIRDFDFVVEGDGRVLAKNCLGMIGGSLELFEPFLTAKIVHPSAFPEIDEVDFATARTEEYPCPGSLPVVFPSTIEEDLRRRDFSINAMALPLRVLIGCLAEEMPISGLEQSLLDPFQGSKALQEGVIEILHPKKFYR